MMLKVTLTGAYYSGSGKVKETVDFELQGIIPNINQDRILQACKCRMVKVWLANDKTYTKRVDRIVTCYVDNIEEVDGDPSIIGKNIKELSWDELQALAVWKNIKIPLYKTMDLRTAREKSYLLYSELLGNEIDPKADGYNYASLPELIIEDDGAVREPEDQKTNEDIIENEQENESVKDNGTLTLAELKKVAKAKGIKIPQNVSKKELEKLVFGGE